jgi:hypothetical protein
MRLNMKKYLSTLAFMSFFSLQLFAGASFKDDSPQARSDGTNILVQWETVAEMNIQSFTVERSAGTGGNFVELKSLAPRGGNSLYEFVDQSAFKIDGPTASIYQYRIKVVDLDGSVTYSKTRTVSHNVSSVRRTWGSLKAMFR